MKLVFLSNFFNHHQKYLSNTLYELLGEDYKFIETSSISKERLKLGWGEQQKPSFVLNYFADEKSKKDCQELIDQADVVIYGSAPFGFIKTRLKNKKIVFVYSERIYKSGSNFLKNILKSIKYKLRYLGRKNVYLLSASGYSAGDYARFGTFKNKAFKWGYFPETKTYKINSLMENKQSNKILWCGRLIGWKHPEHAVEVAKALKNDGYNFTLDIIGAGALEDNIKKQIKDYNLEGYINFLGAKKPEEVREYMEKAGIYLFTSDFGEGWGAVLNESMNSACAVVANHGIGAVPFLLKNKENGLIYKNGDLISLISNVKFLLDNKEKATTFGENAYNTIITEWNATQAGQRLVELCKQFTRCNFENNFKSGPLSVDSCLKNNWFDS